MQAAPMTSRGGASAEKGREIPSSGAEQEGTFTKPSDNLA